MMSKEQKLKSSSKIGPKGVPNQKSCYISAIFGSPRPKNWQMLRTNWYNSFIKGFMYYKVRKNWLLGAKGAKIAVD